MISLSCGVNIVFVGIGGTPTPIPSPTSTATNTPTPVPTSTSNPTATLIPTPAPVGSTITYHSLQITVLGVRTHASIDMGGDWFSEVYHPMSGDIFIEMGVLVRNLENGNPIQIKWDDIYILEENGGSWLPNFGSVKNVNHGAYVDPFLISLYNSQTLKGKVLEIDEDTYLRLIYSVNNDTQHTIIFGIEDAPQFSFRID